MPDAMESSFSKAFGADPAPLGLAGFAFTTFLHPNDDSAAYIDATSGLSTGK